MGCHRWMAPNYRLTATYNCIEICFNSNQTGYSARLNKNLLLCWLLKKKTSQKCITIENHQSSFYASKYLSIRFALFKTSWQMLGFLPQLSPFDSYSPLLRALQWGALWSCTWGRVSKRYDRSNSETVIWKWLDKTSRF